MIRILAVLAAFAIANTSACPEVAANLDKDNAIVIDTTKGRIIVKTEYRSRRRSMPSASSSSRATAITTTCRSIA